MSNKRMIASRIARFVGACIVASSSHFAVAAPVTIDFNDMPTGSFITNFVNQGITFSPSCHYDLSDRTDGGATVISNWIGFDFSGCYDGSVVGYNHDYLGPAAVGNGGKLYVAAGAGEVLSLMSFKFLAISADSGGFTLRSSAGGIATYDWSGGIGTEYNFSGPAWTNLEWLVFSTPGGEPAGFDDLQLQVHNVSEPSSLALFGLCLVGLARLRGRMTKSRHQAV